MQFTQRKLHFTIYIHERNLHSGKRKGEKLRKRETSAKTEAKLIPVKQEHKERIVGVTTSLHVSNG